MVVYFRILEFLDPIWVRLKYLATYVAVYPRRRYFGSQSRRIGFPGIERLRNGHNASIDAIKSRFVSVVLGFL